MNINCVILVFYHATAKYASTDLKVDFVDICMARSGMLFANSALVMYKNGEKFCDYSQF